MLSPTTTNWLPDAERRGDRIDLYLREHTLGGDKARLDLLLLIAVERTAGAEAARERLEQQAIHTEL